MKKLLYTKKFDALLHNNGFHRYIYMYKCVSKYCARSISVQKEQVLRCNLLNSFSVHECTLQQ